MSFIINLFFLIALTQGCASPITHKSTSLSVPTTACPTITTCFTPGHDCTKEINQQISRANHTILVEAYQFTSKPIANALINAKNKGVSIKVILDKSQIKSKYSMLALLYQAGIPIWIDTKPAIAHNKIMIIDNIDVITGSFNFTDSAQKRNAENVVFISDKKTALHYTQNWKNREAQSKSWPY